MVIELGLNAKFAIDTGYERISRDNPAEQGIKYLLQQGRFVFRTTPTYSRPDGWFVQGQAEVKNVALAWLFLRMAQEGDVRQELIESGVDERTARRAVRYRRWSELT